MESGMDLIRSIYKADLKDPSGNVQTPRMNFFPNLLDNAIYSHTDIKSGEGKPVSILKTVPGADGFKIDLDEDALKSVFQRPEVINHPVMLLSVSGAFRKGKSFLLNFFLRYLKRKGYEHPDTWLGTENISDGFEWRGGKTPHTQGIVIFNEPFIITKGDQSIAVLLMDTQGLFDNNSDKKLCTQIFAFSTLLSSVQVFNLSQQIQENDLEYLQCFTEYAKVAQKAKASNEAPFQKLMFVIRDWQELDDHDWGLDRKRSEDGSPGYLSGVLSCVSNNQELTSVRRHLQESFSDLNCFLMPHPGLKVAISKKIDSFVGDLKDISPDFLEHVQTLADSLLNPCKLVPKKIHGNIITGNSLVNYAIACSRSFASGHLPEPQTMLKSASDCMNLQTLKTSLEKYTELMESACKQYYKEGEIESVDQKSRDIVLEWFDANTMGNSEVFREKLIESLRQSFEIYQERNYVMGREISRKVRESANQFVKEYVWKMEENTKEKALDENSFQLCHKCTMADMIAEFVTLHHTKLGFSDVLDILKNDINFSFEVLQRINKERRNLEKDQKKGKQLKMQNLVHACLDIYKEEMLKFSRKHMDMPILINEHSKIRSNVIRKCEQGLQSLQCEDEQMCMNQLLGKIEEEFKNAEVKNESNRKMLELLLTQKRSECVQEYKFMMNIGMKSNYILPEVLEETHTKSENVLISKMMKDNDVTGTSYAPLTDPSVRQAVEDLRLQLRDIYIQFKQRNEKNRRVFLQTTTNLKSFFSNFWSFKR